jgi:hypothetical protein
MKTTTVTVTRRTRTLGYGSTSQPVRGRHGLEIDTVDAPDVTGTARQVIDAHQEAARRNSGHDWRGAFFVGGRRVVGDRTLVLADLDQLITRDGSRYMADAVTLTVEAGE